RQVERLHKEIVDRELLSVYCSKPDAANRKSVVRIGVVTQVVLRGGVGRSNPVNEAIVLNDDINLVLGASAQLGDDWDGVLEIRGAELVFTYEVGKKPILYLAVRTREIEQVVIIRVLDAQSPGRSRSVL